MKFIYAACEHRLPVAHFDNMSKRFLWYTLPVLLLSLMWFYALLITNPTKQRFMCQKYTKFKCQCQSIQHLLWLKKISRLQMFVMCDDIPFKLTCILLSIQDRKQILKSQYMYILYSISFSISFGCVCTEIGQCGLMNCWKWYLERETTASKRIWKRALLVFISRLIL